MAKGKKACEFIGRTFQGTRKGVPFTVEATLPAEDVIAALGGIDGAGFATDCAFEVHKMLKGFRFREVLVAWGYHMAQNPRGKAETRKVSAKLFNLVRFRKPLQMEGLKLSLAGPASKYAGDIIVNNGEPFGSPAARFYGTIAKCKDGAEWKQTGMVTDEVRALVDKITS